MFQLKRKESKAKQIADIVAKNSNISSIYYLKSGLKLEIKVECKDISEDNKMGFKEQQ